MTTEKDKDKSTSSAASSSSSGSSGSSGASSSSSSRKAGEWPARGYDGPPPWELAQQHLEGDDEARDRATGDRPWPYTGPGAVTHRKPLLTQGSAGPDVEELAHRLRLLGYESNSIVNGRNAAKVLDASVWSDVAQFQSDYGVREDASSFGGGAVPAETQASRHVGPYTWQALIQLSDERAAELEPA